MLRLCVDQKSTLFLRVVVFIVEVAAALVQAANHRRRWRGLQKASMFELNSHSGQ
jgi:hypothetical protein